MKDLTHRLAKLKESHQKQMGEVNIQLQQVAYFVKTQTNEKDKGRKTYLMYVEIASWVIKGKAVKN